MRTKTLIAMFLTSTLLVSLAGCNDPIEQEPDIVEPGNGNGDDGDDGDTNGDGGDNGHVDPATGTWENKDEDDDGTLDANDDFPFDPNKVRYTVFNESEPNDNPSVATPITEELPFKVKGRISDAADNGDLYKFSADEGMFISARVVYESTTFKPKLYFSDDTGRAINSSLVHTNEFLKTAYIITMIPSDGKYHLGVIDENSGGGSDFAYEVDVFEDNDADGIDDNREFAIGVEANSQDTDRDQIPDFFEFYVGSDNSFDLDGDNLPNLIDLDSDGDGIGDELEQASNPDNDHLFSFLDFDSDNDGVVDAQERKNDRNLPKDSDNDGIADYLDLDNDNDHILDVNDLAPYVTPPSFSIDDYNHVQLSTVAGNFSGGMQKNRYRIGDSVTIKGMGYSNVNQPLIVLYNNEHTFNLQPTSFDGNGITFDLDVPQGKYLSFVYTNGKKTNNLSIEPREKNVPMIFGSSSIIVEKGQTLRLRGVGFSSSVKVLLGNKTITPTIESTDSLSFTIPQDVTGGELTLSNEFGVSNTIMFNVSAVISLSIVEANNSELLVSTNPLGRELTPYSNNMEIKFPMAERAHVFFFKRDANKLVREFSAHLDVQASGGYEYQIDNSKYEISLHNDQYDIKPIVNSQSKKQAFRFPMKAAGTETSIASTGLVPNITDYMDSYFNFTVAGTTYFENGAEIMNRCKKGAKWRELFSYDGCVELQNRTQLYLSTRIYKLDDKGNLDASEYDKAVKEHITNPWDTNIAGSISGKFLIFEYWAKDKLYDEAACIYKPCLYQVLTPGVNPGAGPSPFVNNGSESWDQAASKAKRMLAIRTIIDNIFIRFYEFLFEHMGVNVDTNTLIQLSQITYTYSPKIVEEVDKLMSKDNVTSADFDAAADQIIKELYDNELKPLFSYNPKFGPMTSLMIEAIGIDSKAVFADLIDDAVQRLTPVYGQLKTAYELAQVADVVIQFGDTIKDFVTVPEKADFVVTWGLNIVDISPKAVLKKGGDQKIEVYGVGFNIDEGWIWDTYPEFTFTDSANASHKITISNEAIITEEGNVATLTLPGNFIENSVGPITLSVIHDDVSADSPYDIEVVDKVIITEITPDVGKPQDLIEITGAGFSDNATRNVVEFQGKNGKVRANVIYASANKLQVKVPIGASTGNVTVSVGPEVSNGVLFTIPHILVITYGDNGNFNDDVYKLKVNGEVLYDNETPERQIGPIEVALTAGVHTVELEGIKADDGIGTYYIRFEGDVQSVSGDELEGRDLCPQVTKSYSVNVGPVTKNSALGKRIFGISRVTLQTENVGVTECAVASN